MLRIRNVSSTSFSPDGSVLAASDKAGSVRLWKYNSSSYIPWRAFQDQSWAWSCLEISPTLSSILGNTLDALLVYRLHDPPTTPEPRRQQFAVPLRSGDRIASAHEFESVITILDLHSPNHQFIDTGVKIRGLSIVGNFLLAAGSGTMAAWLLTEVGLVCGASGNRRAGRSDSIWTVPWEYSCTSAISIIDQVARIYNSQDAIAFHTQTGEILRGALRHHSRFEGLDDESSRERHRIHWNRSQRGASPEGDRESSRPTFQRGWVDGPGGRNRLWVPVEWGSCWGLGAWRSDITTMEINPNATVIIKF